MFSSDLGCSCGLAWRPRGGDRREGCEVSRGRSHRHRSKSGENTPLVTVEMERETHLFLSFTICVVSLDVFGFTAFVLLLGSLLWALGNPSLLLSTDAIVHWLKQRCRRLIMSSHSVQWYLRAVISECVSWRHTSFLFIFYLWSRHSRWKQMLVFLLVES